MNPAILQYVAKRAKSPQRATRRSRGSQAGVDWEGIARDAGPLRRVRLPVHVLADEALEVLRFMRSRWNAKRDDADAITKPGLELAGLDPNLGVEVQQLHQAVLDAERRARFHSAPPPDDAMPRATRVLRELVMALRYVLRDVDDARDRERLARLRAAHRRPVSQDAMASALDEYAAFARRQRDRLARVEAFDADLVVEAPRLARQLREISARRLSRERHPEKRQAIELRNRLAALLYERLVTVRAAARFVFRDDPDTARLVTSAYERKRRARYRPSATH